MSMVRVGSISSIVVIFMLRHRSLLIMTMLVVLRRLVLLVRVLRVLRREMLGMLWITLIPILRYLVHGWRVLTVLGGHIGARQRAIRTVTTIRTRTRGGKWR
jgi:uncharacterized membrane protein